MQRPGSFEDGVESAEGIGRCPFTAGSWVGWGLEKHRKHALRNAKLENPHEVQVQSPLRGAHLLFCSIVKARMLSRRVACLRNQDKLVGVGVIDVA